jgi:hypothetical protein
MQPFAQKLHLNGNGLRRRAVDVLQVNMGRYCNLACIHCHVESGPTRREMMSRQNVEAVLGFFARSGIPTMDITGGAPELHPDFDHLVAAARELGRHVMDRCNLTVIFEPGKQYLPEFFKRHEVELVCSLPCYSKENVDKQRGKGTFDASIRALQRLNEIGYGQVDSAATLDQVMCHNLISIGWDGSVYDCDFNQMLDLPLMDAASQRLNIASLALDQVANRPIIVGDHCYACTAGAGSSCGGALVS